MSAGIRDSITGVLNRASTRAEKAAQIAEVIRKSGNHRWAGLYDVGPEMVSIIAFSGPDSPAYPQFPITKGVTAAAIRYKKTVMVNDVRNDPRYLTAFGNTLSEIIVPVLDERTGAVVGTIDVESERLNAFTAGDQQLLEECAEAARPLWV